MQVKNEQPQSHQLSASGQLRVEPRQDPDHIPNSQQSYHSPYWNRQQNLQYLTFLQLNKRKLKEKHIRHCTRFFEMMSRFLKIKTPLQCRGHHKKMELKYKYPYRIIKEEIEKQGKRLRDFQKEVLQLSHDPVYAQFVIIARNEEDDEERFRASRGSSNAEVEIQTEIEAISALVLTREEYESRQPVLNIGQFPFFTYFPGIGTPHYHHYTL